MRVSTVVFAIVLLAGPGFAKHADRALAHDDFDKLKVLAGDWEGKEFENGKETATTSDFRMISGNSVLMNRLNAGTADEMITMIHMDGKDLLATHYCAVKNQPRMRAVPNQDPKVVAFVFKDATDVGPKEGRMDQVKFTLVDNDHHIQEWTFLDKGQAHTGRFEFTRKK